MISRTVAAILLGAVPLLSVSADSAGYVLPSSGTASTTQFLLGPELSGGTACGLTTLPNGASNLYGNIGSPSNGPGFLYAAINQLGFGANPEAGAGGPGGACGVCYKLTPVSGSGQVLYNNAMTFRIIDECPISGSNNCNQCSTSSVNGFGQHWHFDIASDAMSTSQYDTFFNGVTDGSNWNEVQFAQVGCNGYANDAGSYKSWGCSSGCKNNDAASVCADV